MTKLRAFLAVLGGALVHVTIGTFYTFGNMTSYLTSYIRQRSSPPDLTYHVAVWVMSVQTLSMTFTLIPTGFLSRRIGTRWTALLGSVVMSAGVALTFFTVRHSFYAVLGTYGVMFGLGMGLMYVPPLACAMKWLPERKGLASGLVLVGYGGGAFVFNPIITEYLNPDNLSPDVPGTTDPASRYYNDKNILDKVPGSFLLLSGIYIAIQLIGALMITDPPPEDETEEQTPFVSTTNEDPDVTDRQVQSEPVSGEDDISRSLTPRQMVRTGQFYMLCTMFLLNGLVVVVHSSLWKAFGQTKIRDDHFLALVGSFASVMNALGRPFWGGLADRYSFRVAMMILCLFLAIFTMTLGTVPDERDAGTGSKVMFFIWLCVLFGTFSGNFSLLPMATAKAFGPDYVSINYGIIFTIKGFAFLVGGVITTTLMDRVGWLGMLGIATGATTICGVLAFFYKEKPSSAKIV